MKNLTFITFLLLTILCSNSSNSQSTATYDINFTSSWNASDHGTLPSNAHWSNLVGATHNTNITFLEIGSTATVGIENVAETGSNTVFNSEVQSAIDLGNASQWLQTPFSPFAALSNATLTDIVVSENFSLLTLVSMIAPSPDWIIAINSVNLWDTNLNQWKASLSIDLFPFDAGTENGFGYSGDNVSTEPRGVISNIASVTGYPFNSSKIGTLTITLKTTSLSVGTAQHFNDLNIFPNPSRLGVITLTNTRHLKGIEIYNTLGKRVDTVSFKTPKNSRNISINHLKKGVYIIKLASTAGNTQSKKLIVN